MVSLELDTRASEYVQDDEAKLVLDQMVAASGFVRLLTDSDLAVFAMADVDNKQLLSFLKFHTGRIRITPTRRETTRRPGFASKTDRISCLGQDFRISNKFFGKSTPKITRLFQPPNRLSGEDSATGGPAGWGITKGTGETNALTRHSVKGRSLDHRIPVSSSMSIGLII